MGQSKAKPLTKEEIFLQEWQNFSMGQLKDYPDPTTDQILALGEFADFTLVGPNSAGKTSFILTHTQEKFPTLYEPTKADRWFGYR